MAEDVPLVVHEEPLLLLPERAVYWRRRRVLLIADPHFGKAAAFRAGGIPVPGGTTAAMLRRLDAALERTGATQLICLGDLLHARDGRAPQTLAAIAEWRRRWPPLAITLVRGNHDLHAGDPPAEWKIECLDGPVADVPFVWRHEPPTDPPQAAEASAELDGLHASTEQATRRSCYPVCGHVHPAVALSGNGHSLSLPCFYFGPRYGLLPAFGEFTGTAVVRPRPGDTVYVLTGQEIIAKEVKP